MGLPPQHPMTTSLEELDSTPAFHDGKKEMPAEAKCTRQPMKVQCNAAFLIDVRVIPLDDLPADGNGRYVNNRQVTHTYTNLSKGKWKKKGSSCLALKTKNEYHLTREYRKQGDFRQTISYMTDINGDVVNNVALVQYTFTGKEHDLAPTAHGNAKRKKVFTRTKPSVRQKLKENLTRYPVSEAVAKTRRELGGPLTISSDAEMPRGRTQAYDIKRERVGSYGVERKTRETDEMTSLNWFAHTEGKDFVRMQALSGEPLILLATDNQLADLSRFCTQDLDFSHLSVDPTFNFGDFSVTPTSYRNILFESVKTGKCPVFIGPIFIHHTKYKETYLQCFDKLKSLVLALQDLVAFGTDGEHSLSEALSTCFTKALHLRCFRHFEGNVRSKLSQLHVTDFRQYLSEIFGKQEGRTYQPGLLDAATSDDFDAILLSLKQPWAERESRKDGQSKFHDWMKERASIMKNCMIADVRTKAGLGFPPDKYYTNDSENTNGRLRHKTHGKELGEMAFAKAMKEMIEDDQEAEVILALFGPSERYELREQFKQFQLSAEEWWAKNERQRKDYVQRIYALSIDDFYTGNSHQASLYSTKTPLLTSVQLSLPHDCVTGSLDLHIAEFMWKKASRIISQPNSICPAPSKDGKIQTFSVISETGNVPHCVQIYHNFKATCTCRNFKPKHICSHTVAVTEKEGVLENFVKWYKGQNIKGGLSSVATINVNTRESGRKQGAKHQRKAKESAEFVLPMPSSFLGIERNAAINAGTPISTATNQQSSVATSLPSTPGILNQSSAWNSSTAASFPSLGPRTQSLFNDSASQAYQASTHQLMHLGAALQPQHWTSPLTTEQSHVPSAAGGVGQDHPFRFPWPLQQPFPTTLLTQRLPPQIPTTQQLSCSGIRPLQPSVPQGFPLPPKPAIPESSSPFFLMKLKGNISKCNGCEGSFQKTSHFPDSMAVIGRSEMDWYPYLYLDGSKCWKLGREQRKYYHLNLACLRIRRPWFHEGHLQHLLTRTEGGLTLTEELTAFIKQCFYGIAIE